MTVRATVVPLENNVNYRQLCRDEASLQVVIQGCRCDVHKTSASGSGRISGSVPVFERVERELQIQVLPIHSFLIDMADAAAKLKEEGNAHFSKKEYSQAYDKYTSALKKGGENAILYANRAACCMGLGK